MSGTSMRSSCVCALTIVAAAAPGRPAHGQCQAFETDMVTPSDGSTGDHYGYAVAVSGDAAIAGAPFSDEAGSNSGSGYIYVLDGGDWIEQPKLAPGQAAAGDKCGRSVGVSGDVAIFGAPEDTVAGKALAGSAYVFRFDGATWSQESNIVPTDSAFIQYFGSAVCVDASTAIVGAPGDSLVKGAAYMFQFDGDEWIQVQKLVALDGAPNDNFGMSVSLGGDVALIGAPEDDSTGSAYVFRLVDDVWLQETKLAPPDIEAGDEFGGAVAIAGDLAVVGAWNHNGARGAAYVFRYDGVSSWTLEETLTASDGSPSDQLGWSIAADGNLVIAGAPGDSVAGTNSGSAYLFGHQDGGWSEQAKLLPSNGASSDYFGSSAGIDGDAAAIGAYGYASIGSVYIFRGLSDCNANQAPDLCDIAGQESSDADGDGTPDECQCPWDLDGGGVGVTDLLVLLSAWGTDPGGLPDFDGDQDVDVLDLLEILNHWGQCG